MKCTNLKEVVLPDDFIGVNLSMFSGCSSLETIHFPQSLKYISSDAFSYCSIKSLTIPKSAEGISWDAFYSCKQLEGIIIEDSSTPLICYFDLTANSAPALKSFYLGRDITNDATADFSTNITSLTIGPSVTAVPYSFGDKLQEIICKIKNPTNVTERFSKTTKANAILKVPEGTQELYENADGWKGFFNIETFKDDGSTSIRTIDGYRCDDTWYNLNGQRTAPPLSKGMFIKNGKKVIVK